MADNRKYAKALLDYVQMPMAQLGAVFGTTPQKMSKALRQEGSNIYESMKSAVTAPGRALQGQMNPQMMMDENGNIYQDDSRMNQEAMNLAMNVAGGGFGSTLAKPAEAGSLGMFIGKRSPSFNPAKADLFAQLESKGVSPQEAWRQTGTLRGPEGALRQEISDRKSIAIPMSEWGWGARADAQAKNSTGGLLNEFLKHNELNKSYPDALNTWTRIVPRENAGGSYSIDDLGRHKIQLGLKEKAIDKSTALHELQHLIQQEEGFAKGGSPNEIGTYLQQSNPELYTKLIKSGELNNPDYLMNAYKNLAGEAEARLTENRMNLTPQQRLKHFPYNQGEFGLDVPFESLTVRK